MDTTNIKNKINLNIKDNQAREITAEKVREVLHSIVDEFNENFIDQHLINEKLDKTTETVSGPDTVFK